MALHTIRSLYPFELCMEMLDDSQLPNELRAAMCVLTRQLYIESPARRARVKDANATSVWNWDALLDGPKSSATFSESLTTLFAYPVGNVMHFVVC